MRRLILLIVAMTLTSAAKGADLPDAVSSALSDNGKDMGTLTVTWERLRVSDWEKGRLAKELEEENYSHFERPYINRVILQDRKYYALSRMPQDRNLSADQDGYGYKEASCDLKYWYNGSEMKQTVGRGETPFLAVQNLEILREKGNSRLLRTDYFSAAGYWVPGRVNDMGASPTSLIVNLTEAGAKIAHIEEDVVVNGRHCIRVDLQADEFQRQFWLAPDFHFAILQQDELTPDGKLVYSIINDNFEQLPRTQLWLPREVVKHWHHWKSHPRFFDEAVIIEEFTVTELGNTRVDEAVFQLKYDYPGSIIADARAAEAYGSDKEMISYRMPADPEDLDAVIRSSIRKQQFRELRQRYLMIGIVVLNLLIIGLIVFFRMK